VGIDPDAPTEPAAGERPLTGATARRRTARALVVVLLVMGVAAVAASAAEPGAGPAESADPLEFATPPTPAGTAPAGTAPAGTIPASTIPASTIPASTIPASTIPASTAPLTTAAPIPPLAPPLSPPVLSAEAAVGAEALARFPFDVAGRLPDWELAFLPGRSGVRALTLPRERRIEVYVRASDTPEGLQRVLAHEVGHALDVAYNDAVDRARWRTVRGVGPEVPWWPDGTTFDFDTLAGDFAEAFSTWLVGSESVSEVGGPFTPEQLSVVADLVG
jgi:hypothetical protein